MSQAKALAILLVGIAVAAGGLVLVRHVDAIGGQAEAERLNRSILEYVAEKNPTAPIRVFKRFPDTLVAETRRANLDHCLALAQAQVESDFRHDAVGKAGEIGLFQILPSTAELLEPIVGRFKRPREDRNGRDLGDLADPVISTRFAMAYLRDILTRKPDIRDALSEYNGGPAARGSRYYSEVLSTYVQLADRPELRCRVRELPKPPSTLTFLRRV